MLSIYRTSAIPPLGGFCAKPAASFPDTNVTVLCGHTHGEGTHREGNLTVFTGGAEYFEPKVDRVILVE